MCRPAWSVAERGLLRCLKRSARRAGIFSTGCQEDDPTGCRLSFASPGWT